MMPGARLIGADEADVGEALVDELHHRLLAVAHDDDLRRRGWIRCT
jgi:hypothetical protein